MSEETANVNITADAQIITLMGTDKIALALAKAQSQFKPIIFDSKVTVRPKDQTKAPYQFEYATLSNILAATREALSKNELAISQTFKNTVLTTRLLHSSGQQLESVIDLPIDAGMNNQDIGGVMTYFKRYSISALIGVSAEKDDDANGADGNQIVDDEAGNRVPSGNGMSKKPTPAPAQAAKQPSKTTGKPPSSTQAASKVTKPAPVSSVPAETPKEPVKAMPYGNPDAKAGVIDAEQVKRIIKGFAKVDVTQEEIEKYAGYPVVQWSPDMKSMALADFNALTAGIVKKEDLLSGKEQS